MTQMGKFEMKKHVCQRCGASSPHRQFRQSHRFVHTGRRPFHCVYCQRQFVRKDLLKIHEMMHHPQESGQDIRQILKKYQCSFCPKAFMYQSHLEEHRVVHTGERNHHCSDCGKRFPLKKTLLRHQRRIHNGDKM